MEMLKGLHVASFTGNLGDNANHQGTRKILSENLPFMEWTQLEIREMYWGKWRFDQEFVDLANRYDFIMIGGGGYFELWVDESITGTTIDLSPVLLKEIKKPLIFYALGCDIGKGAPQQNIEKFADFLDVAFSMDNCLISVRNDGSLKNIKNLLGENYSSKIYKIPDGGAFIQPGSYYHPEVMDKEYIIFNLAGDMIPIRFPTCGENYIDYDKFKADLVEVIYNIAEKYNYNIVFVPHIYKDLDIIADILDSLPDWLRRTRVTVAPYLTGFTGQDYIFDLYRNAKLVLGNRFHANVCSIGLATPSIGLSNYPKVQDLYDELNLLERCVEINKVGFANELLPKIDESVKNAYSISTKYKLIVAKMRADLDNFHQQMYNLIK